MIKVSLRDWAATGRFGPLEIGDSRGRVEAVFGAPSDWMNGYPASTSPIWKYGDIEFYFDQDRLWMIFADDFRELKGAGFDLDAWVLNGSARVEDVAEALKREKILFSRRPFDFCERGLRLQTRCGTTFTFCGKRERKPRLNSVHQS